MLISTGFPWSSVMRRSGKLDAISSKVLRATSWHSEALRPFEDAVLDFHTCLLCPMISGPDSRRSRPSKTGSNSRRSGPRPRSNCVVYFGGIYLYPLTIGWSDRGSRLRWTEEESMIEKVRSLDAGEAPRRSNSSLRRALKQPRGGPRWQYNDLRLFPYRSRIKTAQKSSPTRASGPPRPDRQLGGCRRNHPLCVHLRGESAAVILR